MEIVDTLQIKQNRQIFNKSLTLIGVKLYFQTKKRNRQEQQLTEDVLLKSIVCMCTVQSSLYFVVLKLILRFTFALKNA